jgi:XTP/dITP diphosphohydrolase
VIKLYACSTNAGKIREFALAARQSRIPDISIEPLPNLGSIPPPAETGASFEENAALKATYYSRFTGELVFADDSGLEVDSLGGAPGIYSARFAGPAATDTDNNELLLKRLRNHTERRARFVCALALAQGREVLHRVRAAVEGEILNSPCGGNGFGYDPLFFYPPLDHSLAQVSDEEKFRVSHRGKAMRELLSWLSQRERSSKP